MLLVVAFNLKNCMVHRGEMIETFNEACAATHRIKMIIFAMCFSFHQGVVNDGQNYYGRSPWQTDLEMLSSHGELSWMLLGVA